MSHKQGGEGGTREGVCVCERNRGCVFVFCFSFIRLLMNTEDEQQVHWYGMHQTTKQPMKGKKKKKKNRNTGEKIIAQL